MKNRIIITATFAACLALCAAVWPQTEKVEKTPTPSETTAVIAPQPTLPEAEKPVLPVVTEKKESEMLEAESAPEVATEELPIPVLKPRQNKNMYLLRRQIPSRYSSRNLNLNRHRSQ
mgnify:CR=1 FL=1